MRHLEVMVLTLQNEELQKFECCKLLELARQSLDNQMIIIASLFHCVLLYLIPRAVVAAS